MTQWQPRLKKAARIPPAILLLATFAVTSRCSRVAEPCATFSAKNMRRLRAARGLTQGVLAYDCGINRTYLSSVERS
jgi:hypothetical protein